MISLSVSDAVRHFSELLHRVRHDGEWALLTEGGRPVARMLSASSPPKGADLAATWADGPHLSDEEAVSFDADVSESRRTLSPLASRWD